MAAELTCSLTLAEQEPEWENSECNNTEGSYTCACNAGYAPVRSQCLFHRRCARETRIWGIRAVRLPGEAGLDFLHRGSAGGVGALLRERLEDARLEGLELALSCLGWAGVRE